MACGSSLSFSNEQIKNAPPDTCRRNLMKQPSLWQVSVTTSRDAEAVIAGLLESIFNETSAIYSEEQKPVSTVTIYTSRAAKRLRNECDAMKAGLKLLSCKPISVPAEVLVRKVRREDWTHSWKKYFKTIAIGSALLIRPSWSKHRARPGQAVVVLDPGLSFGTGQHPTTAFCLKKLAAARPKAQALSFLDIGTGSGILAIAAAKLKYNPVSALDNDSTAVRIANANARRNRVGHHVSIQCQSLSRLPIRSRIQYDVVCANLMADLLISEAPRISNRVRPGGKLVLAGILNVEFGGVQERYEANGFNLQDSKEASGWRSGFFVRSSGEL
jgi:ribosomal protein L11 methyltransferase